MRVKTKAYKKTEFLGYEAYNLEENLLVEKDCLQRALRKRGYQRKEQARRWKWWQTKATHVETCLCAVNELKDNLGIVGRSVTTPKEHKKEGQRKTAEGKIVPTPDHEAEICCKPSWREHDYHIWSGR